MLPNRQVLLGMTIGALCATALAAIGPGIIIEAIAEEASVGIDPDRLVRFEGRDYDMQYEDWVDTTPASTARVKKIEMGKVSYVDITTTSTGTYSTDALFSDHIQYPGITVEDVTRPSRNSFSYWSGNRWVSFRTRNGRSVLDLRAGPIGIHVRPNRTCISGPGFHVC